MYNDIHVALNINKQDYFPDTFKFSNFLGAYEVSESSLPLGFNLTAVLDSFDKVMQPECLLSVRRALVAYYDRLDQYNKLKVSFS